MPAGKSIKTCLALSVSFSPIIVHIEPLAVNIIRPDTFIREYISRKRTGNETCEPKEGGPQNENGGVKERI